MGFGELEVQLRGIVTKIKIEQVDSEGFEDTHIILEPVNNILQKHLPTARKPENRKKEREKAKTSQ